MSAPTLFENLMQRIRASAELNYVSELIAWDRKTNCPSGGRQAKAALQARVDELAHAAFVGPDTGIGPLLSELVEQNGSLTEPQRRLVERLHLSHRRASSLPPFVVAMKSKTTAEANAAWEEARRTSTFSTFAPHLKKVLDLVRSEVAMYEDHLGKADHPYTHLLTGFEPGFTTARLTDVAESVRAWLVPYFAKIRSSLASRSNAVLSGHFDVDRQRRLARKLLEKIGYDFSRGNFSETAHPFMTSVSPNDARITTRFRDDYLPGGLFATLHEAGHAIFEQQVDPQLPWAFVRGFLYSLGIHESQSRFWENVIGRSRPFWGCCFHDLEAEFPEFSLLDLEDFYRAINVVRPSAIRIYADEVSYNLHILLRFELEVALLSKTLDVDELPAAFAEKMRAYVGYDPKDDAEGVLQDMHWGDGLFGYFPTYMLGNLASAQLLSAFVRDDPEFEDDIRRGDFSGLRRWLGENVHRVGLVSTLDDLLQNVTGEPLNPQHWFGYIGQKFDELYELP